MQLRPDPRSPSRARRFVRDVLGGPSTQGLVRDVELVVSELVTNSVRHAYLGSDRPITLSVETMDGAVRVEVRDGGPLRNKPAAGGPRPGSGGLGLHIVERLSDSWGVVEPGVVWAVVEMDRENPFVRARGPRRATAERASAEDPASP